MLSVGELTPVRVAARHLQRKIADADLPRLLKTFENIVNNMAKDESKILRDPDDYMSLVNAGAAAKAAFHFVKRYGLGLLFLGILQTYVMAPKDRKVIERASKTFAKGRIQVSGKKAAATYLKNLKEYRLFLDTAKRVIASGKLHTDEGSNTTFKAGPFTLINTGGFSDEVMETVTQVVSKAAQTLKGKGLGRICYGNVQVTNTVGRNARVLAFYLINTDELFVRANLKGKQGSALHNIIHELGHRLRYKFLKSQKAAVENVYAQIAGDEEALQQALENDPSKLPKPGHIITEGRQSYVVTGFEYNRRHEKVIVLEIQGKPGKKATLPLKNWLSAQGDMAFVSPYAKKNPEENFAEMVAYYCEGTLPPDQVELLEPLLS